MLIIFATHPIQYQVPLWQKMAADGINFEVWYFTDFGIKNSYDVQFGKSFSWDLPMLEGYQYRFLKVNDNAAPNKGYRGIILKDNVKEQLKSVNATHVYINGWQVFAYWQCLWIAKSLGLKIIFKGESNDLKPEISWKWPLKKLLLSQFFKRVNYFLYIGQANKRLYLKHGITIDKLLPGLYCVDNDRFYEETLLLKDQRQAIRNTWGVDEAAFCILFSGKFISKKRPLDIIKAVEQLQQKNKIHLIFVGDGQLYHEIKENSNIVYDKENGIVDEKPQLEVKVSIIGFLNQSEIPRAYAIADCLVLPSNYGETWGLVVNEAMAAGVPVIVSDQCGSAEDLVKPINPALVYETGNIQKLSKSISSLMKTPMDREVILKRVSQYSYSSTINSVKKILNAES